MEFQDRILRCVDCGAEFVWTAGEQLFFADKNFKNEPKRCKSCKSKRASPPSAAGGLARERGQHPTNCSACGKETTVPFRPTQGRPVFCRECFQSRKFAGAGGVESPVTSAQSRPRDRAWPFLCLTNWREWSHSRSPQGTAFPIAAPYLRVGVLLQGAMSFHLIRQPRLAAALITLLLAGATACSRGGAPTSAAGPPPPMGVSTITLEKKPIEQASGFIATIRSLRSSTVKPEVDGVVTRIFVKSGDRVTLGAPIAQIKPDKQQATVRSTEASRAGVEADVQYWRQQVKRLEALVAAGAISRQEFEQADNSLRTS